MLPAPRTIPMNDDSGARMRLLLAAAVLTIIVGGTADLIMDDPTDWLSVHVVFETLMIAGALVGTGWTMFFPQGVVAAVLTQVDVPPSWFVALNVGGDEQWLVIGFMVGVGLLLVDRGMHTFAVDCAERKARATR